MNTLHKQKHRFLESGGVFTIYPHAHSITEDDKVRKRAVLVIVFLLLFTQRCILCSNTAFFIFLDYFL